MTPPGLERREVAGMAHKTDVNRQNQRTDSGDSEQWRTPAVPSLGTVVEELARAVLDGDIERARRLALELVNPQRGAPAPPF